MDRNRDQAVSSRDLGSYASFVLRCWLTDDGLVRARLFDVRTGNSYPMSELSKMPEVVTRLLMPLVAKRDDKE